MKFPPGERFEYCNAGYLLLGLVIEIAAGVDFYEWMSQEIFAPAGMRDTGFFELDRLPPRTALGYLPIEGSEAWRTNIYSIPVRGAPDGGLFTTAGDVLRFHTALESSRLLSPDLTRTFLSPQLLVPNEVDTWYGFGLWHGKTKQGVRKIQMSGMDPGTLFYFIHYPEADAQIGLFSNTEGGYRGLREAFEEQLFG